MIRTQKRINKDGSIRRYISIIEGYRPTRGASPKQRVVKNFGCLEDQPNPDEYLKMIKEYDKEYFLNKEKIEITLDQVGSLENSQLLNYGYIYLDAVYKFLELDNFFTKLVKDEKLDIKYNLNSIFKFLVFQRILNPSSKRASMSLIENLYDYNHNFALHDVYRSLDFISKYMDKMQAWINNIISLKIGRKSSLAFYDVTNYYNEIDLPASDEDLRQRGVSKEHRVDPIIQLGLFMDNNNIPIQMDLFKGNCSDSMTLRPAIQKIKNQLNLDRLIVVADKGMNSAKNIELIIKNGDGYVVSQVLKGKKGKRYYEQMLDEKEYIYNKDRTYKYKVFNENFQIKSSEGTITNHERKVLIYWKKDVAKRDEEKRNEKINKAIKAINNKVYTLSHSASDYINIEHYVKETGELANEKNYSINFEKIQNDSLYDGYYCIVTSEQEYNENDIRKVYSQLSKIEESFKITKTNLEARPIYLSTNEHIKAHFQICFVALIILRLVELKMKRLNISISIERVIRALNNSKLELLGQGYIHFVVGERKLKFNDKSLKLTDDNEIINDIKIVQEIFNAKQDFLNIKQERFKNYINKIIYNITLN